MFIHPSADVAPEAHSGNNVRIWSFTQVRECATIGSIKEYTIQLMKREQSYESLWALNKFGAGCNNDLTGLENIVMYGTLLTVDQVLSVGDAAFQLRPGERMKKLIANDASVAIVSHDLESVLDLADRAMWLDHGRSVMTGDPRTVIDAYQHSIEGA